MYPWTEKSPLNFGSHPDPDSEVGPDQPWWRSVLLIVIRVSPPPIPRPSHSHFHWIYHKQEHSQRADLYDFRNLTGTSLLIDSPQLLQNCHEDPISSLTRSR